MEEEKIEEVNVVDEEKLVEGEVSVEVEASTLETE